MDKFSQFGQSRGFLLAANQDFPVHIRFQCLPVNSNILANLLRRLFRKTGQCFKPRHWTLSRDITTQFSSEASSEDLLPPKAVIRPRLLQ